MIIGFGLVGKKDVLLNGEMGMYKGIEVIINFRIWKERIKIYILR